MKTFVVVNLALVASVALVACNSHKKSASSAASASADPAPAASTAAAPAAKPAAKVMVSYALDKAGKKWKGWSAQGVKGAEVMGDGIAGARIAAKATSILDQTRGGDIGFDIIFEQTKTNFAKEKKLLLAGQKNSPTKREFTTDTPDLLVWTERTHDEVAYDFEMHMKVDGKNITCHDNLQMGAGNKTELKREMDACKSLAHKK